MKKFEKNENGRSSRKDLEIWLNMSPDQKQEYLLKFRCGKNN
tara:strand:+ start:156 stop:281 length:126 start_codon:yes stop_codon:yes gene_type:complete